MSRPMLLLLGLLIALVGGFATRALDRLLAPPPDVEPLRAGIAQLAELLADASDDIAATRGEQTRLRRSIEAFDARVASLEARPATASQIAPASEPSAVDPTASAAAGPASDRDSDAALGAELATLLDAGVLDEDGTASAEDIERFWELARSTPALSELIDELEAAVDAAPGDGDARMELADAYVAKLLTVPMGPERGLWGMKAEQQWKAVIERDPQRWDAQFALSLNHSYYPEFLGKTDEALAGMSRARGLLESMPPEPRQAQTYEVLARLHQRKGDVDAAREALVAGLERHPTDADLLAALAALDG